MNQNLIPISTLLSESTVLLPLYFLILWQWNVQKQESGMVSQMLM
jgi:hypothetical protein